MPADKIQKFANRNTANHQSQPTHTSRDKCNQMKPKPTIPTNSSDALSFLPAAAAAVVAVAAVAAVAAAEPGAGAGHYLHLIAQLPL